MAKILEVSAKEYQLIEAWRKFGSLTAGARALSIPQSTASNRKSRLIWRYRRAKQFIREVEKLEAGLPGRLE
jgi:molybdenum-dependent DNA-binding transcriptional regulator ModE